VKVSVLGLVRQVSADEFFEVGAFFTFGDGGGSEVGEDLLKWRH
jgi:hypothetical protein